MACRSTSWVVHRQLFLQLLVEVQDLGERLRRKADIHHRDQNDIHLEVSSTEAPPSLGCCTSDDAARKNCGGCGGRVRVSAGPAASSRNEAARHMSFDDRVARYAVRIAHIAEVIHIVALDMVHTYCGVQAYADQQVSHSHNRGIRPRMIAMGYVPAQLTCYQKLVAAEVCMRKEGIRFADDEMRHHGAWVEVVGER